MTKVLMVEDDPLVSRMYQKVFKFEGFDVNVVENGQDGVLAAKDQNPDIIFLDIMMPKMNGIEVLEVIKADSQIAHIPVVMLTNLSGTQDAENAMQKGAADYLVKSKYKPKEIVDKAKEILAKHASNQGSQQQSQQVVQPQAVQQVVGQPVVQQPVQQQAVQPIQQTTEQIVQPVVSQNIATQQPVQPFSQPFQQPIDQLPTQGAQQTIAPQVAQTVSQAVSPVGVQQNQTQQLPVNPQVPVQPAGQQNPQAQSINYNQSVGQVNQPAQSDLSGQLPNK